MNTEQLANLIETKIALLPNRAGRVTWHRFKCCKPVPGKKGEFKMIFECQQTGTERVWGWAKFPVKECN